MFEESGASGTDDKGPVEAGAIAFEDPSSVCMAGRHLVRLNIPSKRDPHT